MACTCGSARSPKAARQRHERTSQTAAAPDKINLRQGALESSNVQPVIEISHMIEVMRAYEATATLSKSQEDMMRQAIDKLGQMPA